MSKQRFEVKINVEVRETTTSDGTPSPSDTDGRPGKKFFSSMPLCYHDMPYGGMVMIEQQMMGVQQNLLNLGISIAGAVEGAENERLKSEGGEPTEREIKAGVAQGFMPPLSSALPYATTTKR